MICVRCPLPLTATQTTEHHFEKMLIDTIWMVPDSRPVEWMDRHGLTTALGLTAHLWTIWDRKDRMGRLETIIDSVHEMVTINRDGQKIVDRRDGRTTEGPTNQ